MTASASTEPSESEIYDRQIRLWGADAQSKLSSAKVLYINITGTSSEILKNLILAGIRGAVADGRPYPDALAETPTSFLPPSERQSPSLSTRTKTAAEDEDGGNGNGNGEEEEEPDAKRIKTMSVAKAMQPHILELNPLLEQCEINEEEISSIPSEYFATFDIVIASNLSSQEALRISKATSTSPKQGKFYLVHSFGLYACALMDLGQSHTYRKEIGKDKLSDVMTLDPYTSLEDMLHKKLIHVKDRWHKKGPPMVYAKYRAILHYLDVKGSFPSPSKEGAVDVDMDMDFVKVTQSFLKEQGLEETYLGDEDDLKRLADTATADVSPVCAVMGGVLGNEVIKAISGKGEPANNMLLFDGMDGGCRSFTLK
jgi:ubiquitin-like 1-activating enzyme E1 A